MEQKFESFRFSCIQTEELKSVWDFVAPILDEAVKYADGKYTIESIFDGVMDKKLQLWTVSGSNFGIYSACVTQVVDYPAKRVLNLLFIGGTHLPVWLHFVETLKDFAKANQCDAIEEYGRPGWAKYLRKLGFEQTHTVFRLNLNETSMESDTDA